MSGTVRTASGNWSTAVAVVALLGWVFFLYRDSFAVYFLNEDFTWLRHCRLTPGRGLWELLTRDAIGGIYSWRPLLQMSFGVNYAVWGANPIGYRLTSLAWHAVAVCVLYAIGIRLTDPFRALVAASVFAAHPLQVESLSWTCASAAPISSSLNLLAVLAYVRWRYRGGAAVLVLVPFALALLAQETAVILPLLLLSADLVLPGPVQPAPRRAYLYLGCALVIGLFFWLRRSISPAASTFLIVGLDPRWPVSAAGFAAFLIGRVRACAMLLLTLPAASAGLALPLTAVMALAACVVWWRGRPVGLWGALWVAIAFAPYSLLLFGPFERYMYLPLAGFGLLFAELMAAAYGVLCRWNRRAAVGCVATLLVLWHVHMVRQIDKQQARFVERGRLTRILLLDLLRALPAPRAGSTLAFYRLGDLRARQEVFVFGLEDAVRLFYGDDSLRVEFRPLGPATDDAYHLWYHDGRLEMLDRGRT